MVCGIEFSLSGMYTKNTPPLSNSINNQGNLLQVSFLVLTPWIVSFPASYLYSVAEPFFDADESNFTFTFLTLMYEILLSE